MWETSPEIDFNVTVADRELILLFSYIYPTYYWWNTNLCSVVTHYETTFLRWLRSELRLLWSVYTIRIWNIIMWIMRENDEKNIGSSEAMPEFLRYECTTTIYIFTWNWRAQAAEKNWLVSKDPFILKHFCILCRSFPLERKCDCCLASWNCLLEITCLE